MGVTVQFDELKPVIAQFMQQHKLPASFLELARTWYWPLAQSFMASFEAGEPCLLGINGAQGSGKSTLATLLQLMFQEAAGIPCVVLSIDDFYLTRAEREQLAQASHPLFKVRGVPGTHDIDLCVRTIRALQSAKSTDTVQIPRFDKANDDRLPPNQWDEVTGPIHCVILEGWCVGSRAQASEVLRQPCNELEATKDADMQWRSCVNDNLATSYADLFSNLNTLVMLKVPSMQSVFEWRCLQEEKLRNTVKQASQLMNTAQLKQFIEHYERITVHNLQEMPARADLVFHLDEAHSIHQVSGPLAARFV